MLVSRFSGKRRVGFPDIRQTAAFHLGTFFLLGAEWNNLGGKNSSLADLLGNMVRWR